MKSLEEGNERVKDFLGSVTGFGAEDEQRKRLLILVKTLILTLARWRGRGVYPPKVVCGVFYDFDHFMG